MGVIGSLLRGVILALVVGVVAAILGALAALFGCAGGCAWAEPAADLIVAPAPGLGGITMAVLLGGLLLIGLAIVLAPRDAVTSLAFVFALLIAADSFLFWLPRIEPAADPLPIEEPEPEIDLPPVAQERSVPDCPSGSFAGEGGCLPCETEETVYADPQLTFDSLETGAYWKYARASEVVRERDGAELSIGAFADDLAVRTELCAADSLLVYGSASSDGEREVNVARAEARASNLANAIREACTGRSNGLTIFALSLGQSEAPEDVAADRPVSVSVIGEAEGVDPDGPMILDELGYALAEGRQVGPLLDRRERFPRPWEGPSGTIQGIEIKPRPSRTVTVRTPGAPLSCEAPERIRTGLDGAPFLRQ